jgi:hypothetical protein
MSCRKRATNISARTWAAAAAASPSWSSDCWSAHLGFQCLDGAGAGGLVQRLAPGHLLEQKLWRHRRVVLGPHRLATQPAEIGATRERILQPPVGLVDTHRPLHRQPLRGGAVGGEAVRVHLGLERAPALVEHRAVQLEARRQAKKGEVVVRQLHASAFS